MAIDESILAGDGSEIVIRTTDPDGDLEKLATFFNELPDDVKSYLRYNMTDKEVCRDRLGQIDGKNHWRIVAELGGAIVGSGTLDREPYAWTRHVAELRAVVDPEQKGRGIAQILFNKLIELGSKAGVERICTEVLSHQTELIDTLEQVGFGYEFTRRKYAKDARGKLHDVLVMSNDLEQMWKQLAEQLQEMDIRQWALP